MAKRIAGAPLLDNEGNPLDPDFLRQKAVPETTRKSYQHAVQRYLDWGGEPAATPGQIIQYLHAHAGSHNPRTLDAWLAGLGRWHRVMGWTDPTASTDVKEVMRGIRGLRRSPPVKADPLVLEDLLSVTGTLESQLPEIIEAHAQPALATMRLLRDRAILSLGFWGALRASDLADLNREHVRVGQGMITLTLFGKTDRQRLGQNRHIPIGEGEPCPERCLNDWLAVYRPAPGDPLFCVIGNGEDLPSPVRPLSTRAILNLIKDRIASVHPEGEWSAHSLRRGFAVTLGAQLSLRQLMDRGGWKSERVAMEYQVLSEAYRRRKLAGAGQHIDGRLPG